MNTKKSQAVKQDQSVVRSILRIFIITAIILLIPFVAMQFTDAVNWSVSDFLIIGTLLLGTGLVYEIISRQLKSRKQRMILGVILLVILALIWIDLAVGIFGTPISGS